MSDAKLRELERQWRSTGAVEDEAVYLKELVRAGSISPEKLRQLSDLCYPAAHLAVHNHPIYYSFSYEQYMGYIARCTGREGLCRASITRAVEALPAWYASPLRNTIALHRALASAIRIIIAAPTPPIDIRELARREDQYLEREVRRQQLFCRAKLGPEPASTIHWQASYAVLSVHSAISTVLANGNNCLSMCVRTHTVGPTHPKGLNHLIQAVSRELAAWALGNDPLPALLARLEAEAANATPTTPPG